MKGTGRSIFIQKLKAWAYCDTATLQSPISIGVHVELSTGVKLCAMMNGAKRVQLHAYRTGEVFHSPHHPRAHQPDNQVSPLHDL